MDVGHADRGDAEPPPVRTTSAIRHARSSADYTFYAYTLPLQDAHPSLKGSLGLLTEDGAGFSFADRMDPEAADDVLKTARALVLHVLDVQLQRFGVPGLEELASQAAEDYR